MKATKKHLLVQQLAFYGLCDEQIAVALNLDTAALQQRYGQELALARIAATAHLSKLMYHKALRGHAAALRWWMRTLTTPHTAQQHITIRWQSD
jgi:hypothetical protein